MILILSTLLILPESPRWLLYRNEDAKASRALAKIHHDRLDREEYVSEQLARLQAGRDQEREKAAQSKPKWTDLATNRTLRRRLFCVAGILVRASPIAGP